MSSFFRTVGSDSDSDSSSEEELLSVSGSDSGLEGKKKAAPLKNRFLRGGSDSDDSDSESDDMDDSDSDEDKPSGAVAGKANKFLVGAASDSDSDSEDEGRKVVKSAKSKRQDEVDASVRVMENGLRINDWVVISSGKTLSLSQLSIGFFSSKAYIVLVPEFDKLTRLVQRQPNSSEPIPVAYIKVILSLEEGQVEANANPAAKKKMNASNAKAFNTMKQKLKKATREHEVVFEKYKQVNF